MNKITSKYCCIFAMNEIRKITNSKPNSSKRITTYINEYKREFKRFYNKALKMKLGKRTKVNRDE